MMMFKQRTSLPGQSMVELALIVILVAGVSWGGLQLLNGKMSSGTSAFAGQYSGTPVAASSSSSGSGISLTLPTAASIPTSSNSSTAASTLIPPAGSPTGASSVPSSMATPLIQTTGSNTYSLPGHVTSTTTTSSQTNPGTVVPAGTTANSIANVNSGTSASTTNFKPASTFPTINFGSGLASKAQVPQPTNTIPPATTTSSSAQPAAGDGCMGCASSMTVDLGW